jgi:sugar O-acyltransferase (sialic acid O-acetyltransferase NeuD family)
MIKKDNFAIIGYSGHAFVVCDILIKCNKNIIGYCEETKKLLNPYNVNYLGKESEYDFSECSVFIAIGSNQKRSFIYETLSKDIELGQAFHPSAIIGHKCTLGTMVMLGPKALVNPLSVIGNAVIINTGAIIEHECVIDDFAHIAPGAVLAGGVKVGKRSFVGANSVIKQGVNIGVDVIIGAGSVVLNDIPDGTTVVGNPARIVH